MSWWIMAYRISILPWLQNWGILMIAIAYCRQYATCVTIGHRYTFAVLASTDVNHWFVDDHKVEAVKSGRSAAVFEIGRLLVEGAKER